MRGGRVRTDDQTTQDNTHIVFGVKRGHEYLAVLNAGDGQVCASERDPLH